MFYVALRMVRSIMSAFIVSSSSSGSSTAVVVAVTTVVLVFTCGQDVPSQSCVECLRLLALGLGFCPPPYENPPESLSLLLITLRHCARKLKKLHYEYDKHHVLCFAV